MDQVLEFLFLPGFSTAGTVTDVSGRGVGLDVVQAMVHASGGSVRVSTTAGEGTTFSLHLPVTRSVLRCLLVRIGWIARLIHDHRSWRAEMLDGTSQHIPRGRCAAVLAVLRADSAMPDNHWAKLGLLEERPAAFAEIRLR